MDHSSFTGSPAEGVELLGMELLGIPPMLNVMPGDLRPFSPWIDARVATAGRTWKTP